MSSLKSIPFSMLVVVTVSATIVQGGCHWLVPFRSHEPAICKDCHLLSEKLSEEHRIKSDKMIFYLPFVPQPDDPLNLAFVIHSNHYNRTYAENGSERFEGDCWSCHEMKNGTTFRLSGVAGVLLNGINKDAITRMEPYFESWATSRYLDHTHFQGGTTSEDCHGTHLPDNKPTMEQCLACHGSYPELALLTEEKGDLNPHLSHIGEVRCSLCHYAHQKSKDHCQSCHEELSFTVP